MLLVFYIKTKLINVKSITSQETKLTLYSSHILSDTASDQLNQTETNIFLGQLPNSKYVHCECIYVVPLEGKRVNEYCFAIPYNFIKKSYQETTYAHMDEMSFFVLVGSEPNYIDSYGIGFVFDYKVQIIDIDVIPKN